MVSSSISTILCKKPYIKKLKTPFEDLSARPVTLFRRFDIKKLRAEFSHNGSAFEVTSGVENIALHLFGTGAAMVTAELNWAKPRSDH